MTKPTLNEQIADADTAVNNATLINQTSGKVEYYTPADIVEAARRVMGSIDLDLSLIHI